MKRTDQSRKHTERILEFKKRYSVKERLSVLKVFTEYLDKNRNSQLSKPGRIVEEFYALSEKNYDDLYDRYYRKIENIKAGKSYGIDDPDFFELLKIFIIRHAPEEFSQLSMYYTITDLGNVLEKFLEPERLTIHQDSFSHPPGVDAPKVKRWEEMIPFRTIKNIEQNSIYKFGFSNWKDLNSLQGDFAIKTPEIQYYLATFPINELPFNGALIFQLGDTPDIYFGVDVAKSNLLFLKNWSKGMSLCIEYDSQSFDVSETHEIFFATSSKTISKSGFSSVVWPETPNDHWNYASLLCKVSDKSELEIITKAARVFLKKLYDKKFI